MSIARHQDGLSQPANAADANSALADALIKQAKLRFATIKSYDKPDHGLPINKAQFAQLFEQVRNMTMEIAHSMPGSLIFVTQKNAEGKMTVAPYVIHIAYAVFCHVASHEEAAAVAYYHAMDLRAELPIEMVAVTNEKNDWLYSAVVIGRDINTPLNDCTKWNPDTIICDTYVGKADKLSDLEFVNSVPMLLKLLLPAFGGNPSHQLKVMLRHAGSHSSLDTHQQKVTKATISNIIAKLATDPGMKKLFITTALQSLHSYYKQKALVDDPSVSQVWSAMMEEASQTSLELWTSKVLVQAPLHSSTTVLGFAQNHFVRVKASLDRLTQDICPNTKWHVKQQDQCAELMVDNADQATNVLKLLSCDRSVNAKSMIKDDRDDKTIIMLTPIPDANCIDRLVVMNERAKEFRQRQSASRK